LYVDDSDKLLEIAELYLTSLGTDFLGASTAEQGLSIAKKELPDVVLMDVVLPGMDGFEAVKNLKSDPATKNIPVLMLTGSDGDSDIQKGMAAGANGYISKPIMRDRLQAKLQEWIQLPGEPAS
jgi:CheY-like chemotaxis protein